MIPAAARHQRLQAQLAAGTVARARRDFKRLDPANLDGSWRSLRLGERLFVLVSSAQLLAASAADAYTSQALAEQNLADEPEGVVQPRSLSGVASDGRSLETLLYEPVVAVGAALAQGAKIERALAAGESSLMRIAATQVQDAGRQAVGIGITARPQTGYVRMLNPPSCSRCAIMAGRVYRWNHGFQRHPMCDCRHIPTSENVAGDLTTNPRAYFNSLTGEQQDRYFTKAGAQAIRDGADMGQVVNARRGMTTTQTPSGRRRLTRRDGVFTTTAGARGQTRLMPESIYEQAATQAEAVALLKQHGYLR